MALTLAGAKKGFMPTYDDNKLLPYQFWTFNKNK